MKVRALVVCAVVLSLIAAGCATVQKKRKWGKATTIGALIGVGVGGGAGVGYSQGVDQDKSTEMARAGAIGAAIGLVVGGLIGHYFFDEPVETPTPPFPEPTAEPTPLEELEAGTELGEVLTVISVEEKFEGFGFDRSTVPTQFYPALDKVAAQLVDDSSVRLIAEGHTDSTGDATYNLGLGRRRAQAVADYLIERGVQASRIAIRSMGAKVPIASNETKAGRAKNRRVELRLANGEGAAAEPAAEAEEVSELEVVEVTEVIAVGEAAEPAPPPPLPAAEPVPAPAGAPPEVVGEARVWVVYFDARGSDIAPDGVLVLDKVVTVLRKEPNALVSVEGHIDGQVEKDSALSGRRVERVRLYLVGRAVDPARMTVRFLGAKQPADTSGTQEGLGRNRRVELKVQRGD